MKRQKLSDAIDKSDMTKKEFAGKLGVTVDCIYQIVAGVRNPSMHLAQHMYDLLDGAVHMSEIRKCTKHCFRGCPCSQNQE